MSMFQNLYKIFPTRELNLEKNTSNWVLNINCANCNYFDPEKLPSSWYKEEIKCISCIIQGLSSFENHFIEKITISDLNQIPYEDLIILKGILASYLKFKEYKESIKLHECKHQNEEYCFISKKLHSDFELNFHEFIDLITSIILQKKNFNLLDLSISRYCSQCAKIYIDFVKKFSTSIKKGDFYNKLEKFKYIGMNNLDFLYYLFIGPNLNELKSFIPTNYLNNKSILSDEYYIDEYSVYKVNIFTDPNHYEKFYSISEEIGKKSREIYVNIKKIIKEKIFRLEYEDFLSIGDILTKNFKIAETELKLNYNNLNDNEINNLSIIVSVESVQLGKLFPLLVDNYIEEIYLDNSTGKIYLDHQTYGRCQTEYSLNQKEIDAIKTILRIASNKRLDFSNPSIKCTIQNKYFNCRFAIDIKPIHFEGFALDIRKMNKKIFSVPELIYRGMLSSEIAAFFYFCLLNKINLTVAGETNTGKTTLINSLDLLVPKNFRKIYIEEAPESLDQKFYGLHQLKYLVEPSFDDKQTSSKTREIYKLLHRNPDFVYLGEILNKEEAHAMFHCLSAGLKGFQTIHSRSIQSLVNRWQYHFNIDKSCFNDLDILILLKNNQFKRIITEVSEISVVSNKVEIKPLFEINPTDFHWIKKVSLKESKIIDRLILSQYEYDNLELQLFVYKNLFNYFVSKKEFSIKKQINAFQNLSNYIFQNKLLKKNIDWKFLTKNWNKFI